MRWLLLASLAFNVLVLGAMGGRAYHAARHGPVAGHGGASLISFAMRLPAERRQLVWSAVREERAELRPLREKVREARAGIRDALLAEPFDAQRFTDAQARLLEAEVRMRTAAQRMLTRIASQLTRDERAAFAARVLEPPRRARGPSRDHPPDEPPQKR
jgi:uncharacterized membrane protein